MTNIGLIAECNFRGQQIEVHRNEHGKFHVKVNGKITQSTLNANEIVRYLVNAMNEHEAAREIASND